MRSTEQMVVEVALSLVLASLGGSGSSASAPSGFLEKLATYPSFIGKNFLFGTVFSAGSQFIGSTYRNSIEKGTGDIKPRSNVESGVTMAARATAVKGLIDAGLPEFIEKKSFNAASKFIEKTDTPLDFSQPNITIPIGAQSDKNFQYSEVFLSGKVIQIFLNALEHNRNYYVIKVNGLKQNLFLETFKLLDLQVGDQIQLHGRLDACFI